MVGAATFAGAVAKPGSPRRLFAYVGSRTTRERNALGDGITVFEIDRQSGEWKHVQTVGNLVNPSFLILDPHFRRLYAVHGDQSEVSAFTVDPKSGQLAFLNQQSTGGKNPVHLTLAADGKYLLVANYATGTVATLPIKEDGALDPVKELVSLQGESGPHKTQQDSSHPHQVRFDRSGMFLAVPDKGLDRVFTFQVDTESGKLKPTAQASVRAREGSGTRHIDFHPRLPMAYVANELGSTVTAYQYDRQVGELQPIQILPTLPPTYTGNNTASAITLSRSGNLLFISNRGHDSIAIFRINPVTGLMSPVEWQSTQGKGPRFATLDPSGKFMYAANENGHSIVAFRVDETTGKLAPTGQVIKAGSPVCIAFAEL